MITVYVVKRQYMKNPTFPSAPPSTCGHAKGKFLAVVAVFALAAWGVQAATTPVFNYNFPASWDGTGTVVTDLSSAGNNGTIQATPALSASVPAGAPGGTQSITTSAGGITTDATGLLDNSIIAAAGGFRYDVAFNWDGTDSSGSWAGIEKIVDYAGTESLQITTYAGGGADVQMTFGDTVVPALTTAILPNTWYTVSVTFDTWGNAVDGSGDLAGVASMVVNGGTPLTAAVTKTAQGDGLNRPIGIGQLAIPGTHLVYFWGDIYNPSVTLIPEPSSLVLLGLGSLLMLLRRKA